MSFNSTDLNAIAQTNWHWIEEMGWHDGKTVLEALALVCSEVGEAINECRGPEPTEKFRLELADIILRTGDLAYSLNIDLGQACIDKININRVNGNYKNRVN